MPERIFLLTVDLFDSTLDLDALKEFVKTSTLFDNWWNHIPGVFLLVSDRSAGQISEALRKYTHDASFLVMEVDSRESDGWLTERGWNWIRRRSGRVGDESTKV